MRLKGESLETAFQALLVRLEDDELDALIARAQAVGALPEEGEESLE